MKTKPSDIVAKMFKHIANLKETERDDNEEGENNI